MRAAGSTIGLAFRPFTSSYWLVMGLRALGLSVVVSSFLSVASANAQQPVDAGTRAAARTLGSAGVAAYQANDFKTASDKLERAYQVLQVPSLGLWSARALAKTGKLVEAAQRYVDVTRLSVSNGDAQVQRQAVSDAQKELGELTPRIPGIIVKVKGVNASTLKITIDEIELSAALVGESRPVNPGPHHIIAATDAEKAEADVSVVEAEQKVVTLKFKGTPGAAVAPGASVPGTAPEPAPGASASTSKSGLSRTLGWTAVGVGGAGVILGAVTGAMVLSKKSSLESRDTCRGATCLNSDSNDVNSYNSLRTVSTVAFVAGGVLAGTGLVLLLAAPKSTESALAQPTPRAGGLVLRVGLGSAVLGGSF